MDKVVPGGQLSTADSERDLCQYLPQTVYYLSRRCGFFSDSLSSDVTSRSLADGNSMAATGSKQPCESGRWERVRNRCPSTAVHAH